MTFQTFCENIVKIMTQYWDVFLIKGLSVTISLSVIAVFFGAILGALLALGKMSRFKLLRGIITAFIEIIRGTPILLQLYLFYFILPMALPALNIETYPSIAIALVVNSSAYVSEVIRSGIQAVDKGQTEAARSLGLSEKQTMMKIVLPQAIRNILPALGNEFIMMLKETSLASTFFLGDIMTSYQIVKGATYLTLEPLTIIAVIYLCITYPLSKVVERFEKKMANPNSYRKRKSKQSKSI